MINLKKIIKIKKIYIIFIIFVFIFVSLYFAFDFDLRRNTYKRTIAFINLYKFYSIKQYVDDTKIAAEKIDRYIDLSQKISLGKNAMWQGIYDITLLVSKNAKNQNDFNNLQEVYLKILSIDPDIYMVQVWAARALADDDYNKSLEHILKAISLSPVNEEAYRVAANLFTKAEDKKLINKYCTTYKDSILGGNKDANFNKFFGGNNLSKFAISINKSKDNIEFYPKSIAKLNEYIDYDFSLLQQENLKNLNIVFSFLPGTKIAISNIKLDTGKIIEIDKKNITFLIKNGYILRDDLTNILEVLKTTYDDDVINLKFKTQINSVRKIILRMKVSRLGFVSNSSCND
jgi:hypothetical protein